MKRPANFEEFLEKEYDEDGGMYVPKNPSENVYRHYGVKLGSQLRLNRLEVSHLFSPNFEDSSNGESGDMLARGYFELRSHGYNVLWDADGARMRLYPRTKHFNRKTDEAMGELAFRPRDGRLEPLDGRTVLGVSGDSSVCYIVGEPLDGFDRATPDCLRK